MVIFQKRIWSDHDVMDAKEWDWLYKDMVFSFLTEDRSRRLRVYRRYMAEEDTAELIHLYESRKWLSVVGGERFMMWVKDRF